MTDYDRERMEELADELARVTEELECERGAHAETKRDLEQMSIAGRVMAALIDDIQKLIEKATDEMPRVEDGGAQ